MADTVMMTRRGRTRSVLARDVDTFRDAGWELITGTGHGDAAPSDLPEPDVEDERPDDNDGEAVDTEESD